MLAGHSPGHTPGKPTQTPTELADANTLQNIHAVLKSLDRDPMIIDARRVALARVILELESLADTREILDKLRQQRINASKPPIYLWWKKPLTGWMAKHFRRAKA